MTTLTLPPSPLPAPLSHPAIHLYPTRIPHRDIDRQTTTPQPFPPHRPSKVWLVALLPFFTGERVSNCDSFSTKFRLIDDPRKRKERIRHITPSPRSVNCAPASPWLDICYATGLLVCSIHVVGEHALVQFLWRSFPLMGHVVLLECRVSIRFGNRVCTPADVEYQPEVSHFPNIHKHG